MPGLPGNLRDPPLTARTRLSTRLLPVSSAFTEIAFMGLVELPPPPPPQVDPVDIDISRNLLSYVTFSWMTPTLRLGNKHPLVEKDLPKVPYGKQAKQLAHTLDPFWQARAAHIKDPVRTFAPSLVKSLSMPFWGMSALGFTLKSISVGCAILMPYLISDVIAVLTPSDNPGHTWFTSVYSYAALFFALSLLSAVTTFAEKAVCLDLFIQIRAILTGAVYGKALRLSPRASATYTAGKINSLVDVDIFTVADFNDNFNGAVGSLAQIVLAVWLLARELGVTTWIAAGTWVFLSLLTVGLMPFMGKYQQAYLSALDERTRVLREFLYGMSSLKIEGAVEGFRKRVDKAREIQLLALRKFVTILMLLFAFGCLQQVALSTITIVGYDKLGGVINGASVFPILGYIGALTQPSGMVAQYVATFVQMFPSFARITGFLCAEEVDPNRVTEITGTDATDGQKFAVQLENATFRWSEQANTDNDVKKTAVAAPFELSDINLSIPQGSLVIVVGSVGSGKSALLSALTGSMRKESGSAVVRGTVAYCQQTPWILSGSIEDNICGLFGDGGKAAAFKAAASACLSKDLEVLGGTDAIVGEKGVQLSGGQRARIALARAIASNCSVLLLDDPLAALDSHVGKTIFEETLCGELKGRTIILTTHQLQFAARADIVLVLDQGRVVETGAFRDLIRDSSSRLSYLMKSYELDDLTLDAAATTTTLATPDSNTDLTTLADAHDAEDELESARKAFAEFQDKKAIAEDRRVGRVTWPTYRAFIQASSMPLLLLVAISWLVATSAGVWQSILLVQWSTESSQWTDKQYFEIFWITGLLRTVAFVALSVLYFQSTYSAAKTFHARAMLGLASAPMSWFNNQPVGRILNRMTADVQEIDQQFGSLTINLLILLSWFLGSVIILAYATPFMLIVLVVLAIPCAYSFKYYQSSYRELKRLSSILKSPLSAHVSESLSGVATIKAYGGGKRFVDRQESTTDLQSKASFLRLSAEYWIGFRLACVSSCVIGAALLLAGAGVLSRAAVGLSLVAGLELSQALIGLITVTSSAEAAFNAVERLNHFANNLPSECKRLDAPETPKDWPRTGSIVIKNLEVRYSAIAKPVISDLSLNVASGEHVAVVGRTGAGKSSLMLALFRIVEPHAGNIFIDDIDITTLSLQTLREGLTIIVQDPSLYGGTYRYNLDMAGVHTDDEIWTALELTGMRDHIAALPGKLEAIVADSGSDLSGGQRQLLCLAKALLAKPKILILDEAASAVDSAADERLLSAIMTQFKHTTVLSIAHRLNSVAGFDRVAVLHDSKLVELGTPAELLDQEDSLFASMVNATGPANAALIKTIAGRTRDGLEMTK
ncbi:Canalicular multispecific organic anion transporter 2 [Thoreauomyces humboldtii]|nr:Canalicular multispecific organic anion transporter 2 [Thoreauomyces humboldtii]